MAADWTAVACRRALPAAPITSPLSTAAAPLSQPCCSIQHRCSASLLPTACLALTAPETRTLHTSRLAAKSGACSPCLPRSNALPAALLAALPPANCISVPRSMPTHRCVFPAFQIPRLAARLGSDISCIGRLLPTADIIDRSPSSRLRAHLSLLCPPVPHCVRPLIASPPSLLLRPFLLRVLCLLSDHLQPRGLPFVLCPESPSSSGYMHGSSSAPFPPITDLGLLGAPEKPPSSPASPRSAFPGCDPGPL